MRLIFGLLKLYADTSLTLFEIACFACRGMLEWRRQAAKSCAMLLRIRYSRIDVRETEPFDVKRALSTCRAGVASCSCSFLGELWRERLRGDLPQHALTARPRLWSMFRYQGPRLFPLGECGGATEIAWSALERYGFSK